MNLTELLISADEGRKLVPYKDSRGIWSIGIGHNMQANGLPRSIQCMVAGRLGKNVGDGFDPMPFPECLQFLQDAGGLKDAEVDQLFQLDLLKDCAWLQEKLWWAKLNEPRRAAISSVAFNMGAAGLQGCHTFLGLIAVEDWSAAANDLQTFLVARTEAPKRYARLARIIGTGELDPRELQ